MTERRRVCGGARALLAAGLTLTVCGCLPAAAELVLLVDGGVLKVDAYQRTGERIELLLPSGGLLTLSVLRVDRILADEIEDDPETQLRDGDLRVSFSASQPIPDTPYGEQIFAAAQRYELNPQIVAAIVRTESDFDPLAVSSKGAAGLMQLMPSTAQRFGLEEEEVFDPELNLDVGVRYLRWLVDRFEGDLPLVLAGYNAGESAVDRHQGIPPYRETRDYIRRVYSAAGSKRTDAVEE